MVVAPAGAARYRAIGWFDSTSRCTQPNVECISLIPAPQARHELSPPRHSKFLPVKNTGYLLVSPPKRRVSSSPCG